MNRHEKYLYAPCLAWMATGLGVLVWVYWSGTGVAHSTWRLREKMWAIGDKIINSQKVFSLFCYMGYMGIISMISTRMISTRTLGWENDCPVLSTIIVIPCYHVIIITNNYCFIDNLDSRDEGWITTSETDWIERMYQVKTLTHVKISWTQNVWHMK